MRKASPGTSRESGQAAVEAALTLPLILFLILGTLQLFLMLQARMMTEYAAFRATRAGSVSFGNCERMVAAAIGSVLPTMARTDNPQRLAAAYERFNNPAEPNSYRRSQLSSNDSQWTGSVVWIARESPRATSIPTPEVLDFDNPDNLIRLETRLVFWYPLRIPFANWVMSRMALAHYQLLDYTAVNPLMPTRKAAGWQASPGMPLDAQIAAELRERVDRREYVFPIHGTWTMRMMTPPKRANFVTQNCPPTPETL